jgi:hypothetical protein
MDSGDADTELYEFCKDIDIVNDVKLTRLQGGRTCDKDAQREDTEEG